MTNYTRAPTPHFPPYPGHETFLFGASLYAEFSVETKEVVHLFTGEWSVDAHCPHCHKSTTFRSKRTWTQVTVSNVYDNKNAISDLVVGCARDDTHRVRFEIQYANGTIQKYGQLPSVADIAIDEVGRFRNVLKGASAREFNKAIGLAAHGVGIGSFVYLRRIFERLVKTRFDEFKVAEGWTDEDYNSMRMDDKILLLKDHLPEVMVANRQVYGIVSKGIHELEEQECLALFSVVKTAIMLILEEDDQKKRKDQAAAEVAKQIASYNAVTPKKLPTP